jgi:hypothetical protein
MGEYVLCSWRNKLNREELAWAAGFYDGEGCLGIFKNKRGLMLHMDIGQVDRAVLDRFQAAVELGNVAGPYLKKNPNHAPSYSWDACGFEKCQAVVAKLWHWLSPVKRAQAKVALSVAKSYYILCNEAKPEFAARYLQNRRLTNDN